MRQVEQIMGMPITIDIPNCHNKKVFEAAFDRLREIDKRFSTYKPDSEVSRFARDELATEQISQELKEVIETCRQAEDWTNGYFSAWATGPFDPSGYVKGWAIAESGKIIEKHGYLTYCIGAAGDILACSDGDKTWQIGIQDPTDKTKVIKRLALSNGAVASSGNYERGPHIINPKTKQPADELLSVTIIGPDIIKADILATACFAMGQKAEGYLRSQAEYQGVLISKSASR